MFILLFPSFFLFSIRFFFFYYFPHLGYEPLSLFYSIRCSSLSPYSSLPFLRFFTPTGEKRLHLLYSLAFFYLSFSLEYFFLLQLLLYHLSLLSVNLSSHFYLFSSFLFFSLCLTTQVIIHHFLSPFTSICPLLFLNFLHIHTFLPSLIFFTFSLLYYITTYYSSAASHYTEYFSSLIRSNFP